MRMHIELDDELAQQLDRIAGPRGRSAFVRRAIDLALRREQRWADIAAVAGTIESHGHDWDVDPAAWVRGQRRADARRVG